MSVDPENVVAVFDVAFQLNSAPKFADLVT